jgi:hypothetical protein
MNLEVAEQRCLNYLKQASNPLVPVQTLLRHVQQDDQCSEMTFHALLGFLRKHELFRVIDPTGMAEDEAGAQQFQQLGLPTGPYAVLDTRVPTRREMTVQMLSQFEQMEDALTAAQREAQRAGDRERENQITRLLFTAKQLKEKLNRFERGETT